jgi:NAD(P)H-nitrite reductase large subunit
VSDRARRYVIVGNGFAGTTAAEHLRKLDPTSSIQLFGDEPYPLYNRIALPPLLRKQISASKVMMRDFAWHEKHAIRLHLGTRVEQILTDERSVTAEGRSYPYDVLLLATGGRPNRSAAPGAPDAANLMNFQSFDETTALSERLDQAKSAIAVGGSFIAYELAEAFHSRGVETHWLMRGPRPLRRMLDEEAGALLVDAARADGVHLHLHDEVASFERANGAVTAVRTTAGARIAADLVGIGLGITINLELAAGTELATRTGFLCDDRLETNVKGIFAAGDAAEFFDPIARLHFRMGTWNNAGAHGKIAAVNMAGGNARYHDVPEYSSNIFSDQAITQFGLSPELRSDLTVVRKLDRDAKRYRALFFEGDRFAGGVLIGKGNRAGIRRYLDAIKARATFAPSEREALLEWKAG